MTVKVSPKYQVVIPEEIRNELGIKAGMEVQVMTKGNVIFLVPVQSIESIVKKFASVFKESDLKNIRDKKDRNL